MLRSAFQQELKETRVQGLSRRINVLGSLKRELTRHGMTAKVLKQ